MLPITNTKVLNVDSIIDAERFVRHQLSSMQNIIVEAKREKEISKNHELNGLLMYAKAFIFVCKKRELISGDNANDLCELVNCQCVEANIKNAFKDNFTSRFFKDISFKGLVIITLTYLVMFMTICDFIINRFSCILIKVDNIIENLLVDCGLDFCLRHSYILLLIFGTIIAILLYIIIDDNSNIKNLKNIVKKNLTKSNSNLKYDKNR